MRGSASTPQRPRGLMDKASDFESEDCGFESRRGHFFYFGGGSSSLVRVRAQLTVGSVLTPLRNFQAQFLPRA